MSKLFTSVSGQGKPLLVLHGWGMNQQIWQPVHTGLSACAEVTWVDLPGHGQSQATTAVHFDEVVAQLGELLQPDSVILGWSLGGLLAQALAQAHPDKVLALVLVASTPCFVQTEDWPHGLPAEVLQGVADNLQQDYQATVQRFFALQFMGVRHNAAALRALQRDVLRYPAAPAALQAGLNTLRDTDFRVQLPQLPTLWLFGKLDRLIPVSLATALQQHPQLSAGSQVAVLDKAAHVPFVTHPTGFLEQIVPFVTKHHQPMSKPQ